ncbi:MAG: pectic acid lyase, partial [Akkermansiaceae bacterium]|nr:pectic acid lyase [Verrucomicrobiales bacterium]
MKTLAAVIICAFATALAAAPQTPTREQATNALGKGVRFFRTEVSVQGTYLWQYSDDLSKREGEGKATTTQGWVQPPGTPSVGLAFLSAWQATSNTYYLEAARETAQALARGQLLSGGWTYSIDFSDEGRRKLAYRDGGKKTARNFTTFDDDTTQCALRFLMRTDAALGFRDPKIRDTIDYALNSILKAQYPN